MNGSELHVIWVDATNKEILFSTLNTISLEMSEYHNLIISDENITQVAEPKLQFHNGELFAVWTDNRTGINNVFFSSTLDLNVISGDVNGDEIVNILDILLVVNHIIGYQEFSVSQYFSADMNNDSVINILDVIQIINLILGNN